MYLELCLVKKTFPSFSLPKLKRLKKKNLKTQNPLHLSDFILRREAEVIIDYFLVVIIKMSSTAWTVILLDIFIKDVYISVAHLE